MSTPAFSVIDYEHMAHALRLAERGLFTTQPNPRVGCVIAQDVDVVGEGWHQRAGLHLHCATAAFVRAPDSRTC